jgi:hypothetical protein
MQPCSNLTRWSVPHRLRCCPQYWSTHEGSLSPGLMHYTSSARDGHTALGHRLHRWACIWDHPGSLDVRLGFGSASWVGYMVLGWSTMTVGRPFAFGASTGNEQISGVLQWQQWSPHSLVPGVYFHLISIIGAGAPAELGILTQCALPTGELLLLGCPLWQPVCKGMLQGEMESLMICTSGMA